MEEILLVGAGGHALSIVDAINQGCEFSIAGFIEKTKENENTTIGNIPVIGTDDDLEALFIAGYHTAVVSVGSIGDTYLRRKLYQALKQIGFNLPVIADPSSIIADNVEIGEGSFIAKGVIINTRSTINHGAIINTGAIIEHGCTIGSFAHIAPGATLCGEVIIEDNVHIGANATIAQGLRIGENSIIGAGSVVVGDLPPFCTAVGAPAKPIKFHHQEV